MHALGELADQTWVRLEDLLEDFEESEKERQVFLDDTRQFFEERLSIYEQRRNELENELKILSEQMNQLSDDLQLPRILFDDQQIRIKQKRKLINEKIGQFKNLIFERDKELIQLKELVKIKIKLIGNIQINIDQIRSTDQAYSILSDLQNQLNKLKEDIQNLFDQIHSINPDIALNHQTIVNSFLSLNDENESSWLDNHHPITGSSLHSQLITEYEQVRQVLLDEVIRLRTELNQKEPSPPYDLQQELADLRLRKRYLTLLSRYPHKLTSRSTLNEIRQTYEQLTSSLRAQARDKLKRLWDQLDVPHDQRLIPQTKDNQDDYLALNDEINRLETYVESIRPVLTKIQKREWYKREMVEFERHAANPARLRGSSTQLLREERFRKDLSREFPKLTDDLHHMVAEWEESTGKKLIYGGESYLETMNKEKLSVDFELLHLRLLTKCQLLVQPIKDETILNQTHSRSLSTPPLSRNRTPTSRIPTMNFVNTNRKINKQT